MGVGIGGPTRDLTKVQKPSAGKVFMPGSGSGGSSSGGVKMPAFPPFPGTGGASAAPPQTTVKNGKAMVMSGGQWVTQDSAEGKAALGGGGSSGGGGGTSAGAGGGGGTLTTNIKSSPETMDLLARSKARQNELMAKAAQADPNQTWQLEQYKDRLSDDNTQRLMDRAAGATRDVQSAQRGILDRSSAMRGGGAGAGAGQQSDAAVRAMAKASSDIELGRARDLDALVLGGSAITNAPGQREMAYDQLADQMLQSDPTLQAENLKIGQGQLGVAQYRAQNDAANAAAGLQSQQWQAQLQAWLAMMNASNQYGGY